MRTLNLGILAHVDAGKTSLTERLLFAAGVIDEAGSVDDGTTQTDSLALERQRGITIKTAVASFAIGDTSVNLIDTPGHPDFIAEVERALSVLDGAVLVISAVEGVQPQTRILMRALRRLHVPTLLFVNKIDRRGAGYEGVLRAISERLTPAIVAMGAAHDLGTPAAAFTPWEAGDAAFTTRLAEVLAERDDAVLAAYVNGGPGLSPPRLRRKLAAQTARMLVHPVFFGSALTGAGVDTLMNGIAGLLPTAGQDAGGPVSGRVFKIEHGGAGEKVAYVRMFSGTVRTRNRVRFGAGGERKVTAISVFAGGGAGRREAVSAGQVGKLRGLAEVRVGDAIGPSHQDAGARQGAVTRQDGPFRQDAGARQFAPPTLETVVIPADPGGHGALRAALAQMAEQDPLINVRQDDARREISVSLYGEVQKEVIGATLAADFGIDVSFRRTTTICVERLAGTGTAVERKHQPPNPFLATIGLSIEPAGPGSGVEFQIEPGLAGIMPAAFFRAVEDTVRETLGQGLYGWEVIDASVTMTHSGYVGKHSIGHARFTKSLSSTGEDFRKLTPLVVISALRQAGTVVCAPIHRFRLDAPADTVGVLLPALTRLHAVPRTQVTRGASATLEGDIPAAEVHELRQQLAPLTRGDGVLECAFDRYEPVTGQFPARPRSDDNPLDRVEYLQRVTRRANVAGGQRTSR
ncbi:MAG TPA: translation factor GTPase family protein [Streptosporangiaceae bacterium]|nr:translation factor GTPase family protein [Streptosporangiaceae bacterium]